MKLKSQPDDFQVEERTDLVPGTEGPFALYQLEKTGWTTPDALALVCQRWKLDPQRVSSGGLKDRHAHTWQYLTIHRGPQRGLEHQTIRLRYLGQVLTAYQSDDICANAFRIVLRDLDPAQRDTLAEPLQLLADQGFPNYFDDQRFGSVAGPGATFIASHLVRGQFEQALRLALTAPYAFDRADQQREKEILTRHWGDWKTCRAELPAGHVRNLVDHLRANPTDFRGAVIRLRPELRGLYLSAYQSHLWNRILARWLVRETECPATVELRLGPVPFPGRLEPAALTRLETSHIPLPSARWKPDMSDPWLPDVSAVLAEEGLTLAEMQVRGVRELFFSRGDRPAWCRPADLTGTWAEDDRHARRARLTLSFVLPRGSYATLVVKALAGASVEA